MSQFDQDGSGTLDKYEFFCMVIFFSDATLKEKADLIFDLFDNDGS
jgi:Ca2+-binding EF-hand superfamily protein